MLRTDDNGATWCRVNTGTTANLHAVAYVGVNRYLVGGEAGVLRETINGGGGCTAITAVEDLHVADALALAGPFPDPVRDLGAFSLTSRRAGMLRVDVLDASGRAVRQLFSARVAAGERHTFELRTGSLPAGVYYMRARDGQSETTNSFAVVH